MAEMDIRREILSATIQVFNKKGIKFTMDDVAKEVVKRPYTQCLRTNRSWYMTWLIIALIQSRKVRSAS